MRRTGLVALTLLVLLSFGAAVFAQAVQNVEIHGYLQNRFYSTESVSGRFVMERVSMIATAKVGDDGQAYVEYYIHPWLTDQVVPGKYGGSVTTEEFRNYLESAYVDLPMGSGRIRIGKGRQLNFGMTPSYPNRKTSQYGIIAETFTQDRIVGAQFAMKKGMWDGGLTLFTDQPLGTRNIGDIAGSAKVVPHIVDKDVPGAISGKLALTGKLGITTPCFKFHGSACTGKLNASQIDWVGTTFGLFTGVNKNRDHDKFGFDAQYKRGPIVAQGEWYTGKFSFVEITGYQFLVGYEPKDTTKRRAYLRWSALNNDWAPSTNPASWATQQLTLGVVQPIRKGVWAEVNWERNTETPPAGVAEIDNDVLFLELFTGF